MKKRHSILFLTLVAALVLFFAGGSIAGENWKEEQAKMFADIPVKTGDVIDASNWENVKDILPPSVVEWVKKGDKIVEIGELNYDFDDDAAWKEASAKNKGKYGLNQEKEIIVAATGDYPLFIYGDPFPEIDMKNDPDAGIKFINNITAKRGRATNYHGKATTEWVGRNGLERIALSHFLTDYFWNRLDGERPNPEKMIQTEMYKFVRPYDIQGLASLTKRYVDGRSDAVFAYVPAIRRVKKLSGANRSDPYAGSDFIIDDSFGWAGKNNTMDWKVLEQKTILMAINDWHLDKPVRATKDAAGAWVLDGWSTPVFAYERPGSKGAPWFCVNSKYVPRQVWVIEANANDPYYSYGKCIYYVDPAAGIIHKVIYDKAREYWKTMILAAFSVDFMENGKSIARLCTGTTPFYSIVDDRTDHASCCLAVGEKLGEMITPKYGDPSLLPSMFQPDYLGTWSR